MELICDCKREIGTFENNSITSLNIEDIHLMEDNGLVVGIACIHCGTIICYSEKGHYVFTLHKDV